MPSHGTVGWPRVAAVGVAGVCLCVVRHQGTGPRAIDIVDLVGSYLAAAPRRPRLQGPLPLARRHAPQPAGQPRAAIVQVLGLRHRRRRLQLRHEDGRRRVPRGPGHAGRPGRHQDLQPARAAPLAAPRPTKSGLYYQAMAWAEEQFHDCLLNAAEAEPARRYLAERGITQDSVRASSSASRPTTGSWILHAGPRHALSRRRCWRTIGLVAPRHDGQGYYDRFKGRVLFSIRDAQGRPVGFGGRVLPGAGRRERGQVHQLARDAAVFQEQPALRAGRGPRRDPQEPHGAGHGRATPTA